MRYDLEPHRLDLERVLKGLLSFCIWRLAKPLKLAATSGTITRKADLPGLREKNLVRGLKHEIWLWFLVLGNFAPTNAMRKGHSMSQLLSPLCSVKRFEGLPGRVRIRKTDRIPHDLLCSLVVARSLSNRSLLFLCMGFQPRSKWHHCPFLLRREPEKRG